jgi:high-affinity nickel permease
VFGLDDRIASFSDGTTLLVVAAVAVALGLRHASDPDHLAAVTTLIASGRERAARRAARLGLVWGLGHATSLFVFGLPVVLYSAYLPGEVQRGVETGVGVLIVALALLLLLRWRRGWFHERRHDHDVVRTRSGRGAFAIGLVHGMGGTAGVGLLLLAGIKSHGLAVAALALFALCTAVSMALLSTGFGLTLGTAAARRSFRRTAPALGAASLAFGVWYALGAQGVVPYLF